MSKLSSFFAVNLIRQATVTLTNAQIKALPTTPVILIPAPGVGRVAMAWTTTGHGQMMVAFKRTANYTNVNSAARWTVFMGANDVEAKYGNSGQLQAFLQTSITDFFWAFTPDEVNSVGLGLNETAWAFENKATMVAIDNAVGGVLTGGHVNNQLVFTVLYYVYDLATGLFV